LEASRQTGRCGSLVLHSEKELIIRHQHYPRELGGVVNELLARNRGVRPVLLLEGGEAIVGAKQNRTIVASVLVGAGQTVSVPVGCVQQGRWSASWGAFQSAPAHVEPTLRQSTVKEAAVLGHVDQARSARHTWSRSRMERPH
jgi:hypothetical protein